MRPRFLHLPSGLREEFHRRQGQARRHLRRGRRHGTSPETAMVALTSALWVFGGILSPFLTFCSYDLLKKRFEWLASPYLVAPSVVAVSILAFEFTFATPQGIISAHYDHFLFAGIFLLVCYGFLGWLQYL